MNENLAAVLERVANELNGGGEVGDEILARVRANKGAASAQTSISESTTGTMRYLHSFLCTGSMGRADTTCVMPCSCKSARSAALSASEMNKESANLHTRAMWCAMLVRAGLCARDEDAARRWRRAHQVTDQ